LGGGIRTVGGAPALTGQRFRVELPGRRSHHWLRIQTVHESSYGIITYSGTVDDDIVNLFTLTFAHGSLQGKIHKGDRTYLIREDPDSAGYLMHEIDKRALPPMLHETHESTSRADGNTAGRVTNPSCADDNPGVDNGNVRVLFLYTPNAASKAPNGITSLVNEIVSEFNQSAWNSGVDKKNFVSVADIDVVNDEFEEMCRLPIYNEMVGLHGEFSSLETSMAQANADISFLIVDEDPDAVTSNPKYPDCVTGFPHLGRVGGIASPYNESQPYGLSTVSYALGDLTAPHEIGHILGGQHEIESEQSVYSGAPECARGYVLDKQVTGDPFQTMMGGYEHVDCPFQSLQDPTDCVRLPIWSNPDLTHQGGVAGDEETAFMARALDMTMPEVAEWDEYPGPAPGSPSAPGVQSQQCYGLNIVDWPQDADVDKFQLFTSLASSNDDWSLAYHGSGTSTGVIVPSGDAMNLRLRGCNGSGCSDYSALAYAFYYPDCL